MSNKEILSVILGTIIITFLFRTVGDTGWPLIADISAAACWAFFLCFFYDWVFNK